VIARANVRNRRTHNVHARDGKRLINHIRILEQLNNRTCMHKQ